MRKGDFVYWDAFSDRRHMVFVYIEQRVADTCWVRVVGGAMHKFNENLVLPDSIPVKAAYLLSENVAVLEAAYQRWIGRVDVYAMIGERNPLAR